jgi:hypothetical protein
MAYGYQSRVRALLALLPEGRLVVGEHRFQLTTDRTCSRDVQMAGKMSLLRMDDQC